MILTTPEGNRFNTDIFYDISIPITGDNNSPRAWYCDPVKIDPVMGNGFIGEVRLGGNVNFKNIFFNPHGNGTHTECLGHISKEFNSINQHLKSFFGRALVLSLEGEDYFNQDYQVKDRIVRVNEIENKWVDGHYDIAVIRTLPNSKEKLTKDYSNQNPIYFEDKVADFLNAKGITHLMVDLPSVDREKDEGKLAFHHRFWEYPENPQYHKTITEFIFVKDEITDGVYFGNIQIAPFENDASPSKILLFPYI